MTQVKKKKKIPLSRRSATKKKRAAKKARSEAIQVAPKIPEALFWKLRLAAECLQHEQSRVSICQKEKQLHEAEIQRRSLLVSAAEKAIREQDKEARKALKEYSEIVLQVEEIIGRSLATTEICPETFAVIEAAE